MPRNCTKQKKWDIKICGKGDTLVMCSFVIYKSRRTSRNFSKDTVLLNFGRLAQKPIKRNRILWVTAERSVVVTAYFTLPTCCRLLKEALMWAPWILTICIIYILSFRRNSKKNASAKFWKINVGGINSTLVLVFSSVQVAFRLFKKVLNEHHFHSPKR